MPTSVGGWVAFVLLWGALAWFVGTIAWCHFVEFPREVREQEAEREREHVWSFLTPEDRAWFAEQGVEHYPESRWSSEWL